MKPEPAQIMRCTTLTAFLLVLVAGSAHAQVEAMHIDSLGNVGLGTASPTQSLHVFGTDGSTKILVEETAGTVKARELFKLSNNGGPFFVFADTSRSESFAFSMGANGDFLISHQQTPGVQFRLTPGGNLTIAGTLSQGSSREIKDEISPVDGRDVLARVVDLPLATWSYTTDGPAVRHLGPMAEDFHSAFGLGTSDATIASLDTSGVALAAIQGLASELRERDAELGRLQAEKDALSARLSALEEAVAALTAAQ